MIEEVEAKISKLSLLETITSIEKHSKIENLFGGLACGEQKSSDFLKPTEVENLTQREQLLQKSSSSRPQNL